MTRGQWRQQGLGTTVLLEALQSLIDEGYKEVRAVILEGDIPSETVFSRAGFVKIHGTG
jgi:L-amino acid N-acyltransferase YncA